jgi:hypothetical protein
MSPIFSKRMGVAPVVPIQVRSMNAALRASLWNLVGDFMPRYDAELVFVKSITVIVLRMPMDAIEHGYPREWLYRLLDGLEWYTVYDMVEHVAANIHSLTGGRTSSDTFRRVANVILEREDAGYRFIGDKLVEITSPAEIAEIEAALQAAARAGLGAVSTHIASALDLLAKRPEPDYRNAIKEAISAVEAATKLIGEEPKGTLDSALDVLSEKMMIHPAMKSGVSKLYGFTSDGSGIRHALLEASTVDAADARFMIVACSAFVNWLIVKADQAKLLRPEPRPEDRR